jgi:uncharacterized protein
MTRLTNLQARRIALAAQGFTRPRPRGRIDVRHFRGVLDRIGLLQLDSVNALVRSHYLPVFSRLGPYPMDALDRFAHTGHELFEYWGHEASLIPVERYPLFRHRMRSIATRPWGRVRRLMEDHPGFLEDVLTEVRRHGPLTVSDLSDPGERTGPWWGYGKGKIALEWHFACGRLASVRTNGFTRVYDIPERMIPGVALAAPEPDPTDAQDTLLVLAAAHHGIGTDRDLADYYRMHLPTIRPRLEALADGGRLERVEVEGWKGPVYLHPGARRPRRVGARALLSPFDPVVWERARAERLFGFHYRIEIYVPAPKRRYGYYVLPFLLGEDLVARVDLKTDRAGDRLLVRGAYGEEGIDPGHVAAELAAELQDMAAWLGLSTVRPERRGDLMPALRRALG